MRFNLDGYWEIMPDSNGVWELPEDITITIINPQGEMWQSDLGYISDNNTRRYLTPTFFKQGTIRKFRRLDSEEEIINTARQLYKYNPAFPIGNYLTCWEQEGFHIDIRLIVGDDFSCITSDEFIQGTLTVPDLPPQCHSDTSRIPPDKIWDITQSLCRGGGTE